MQTTSKEKLYITLHKPDSMSMWLFDSWLPWNKNCVYIYNAKLRLPSSGEFEKSKDFAEACELIDGHET